tara:strand:+ start:1741 stop:2214 length:474 start_codon:yes stop_codon:yes gene_type:complete
MNNKYINIYNNLMCLTRNKKIFFDCDIKDNFSSRLILFLLHFAFFLTSYKDANDKKLLQNIYDFIFKQIDASLRESGDGDVSVNKKMKTYINVFHSIIPQIEKWNDKNIDNKNDILKKYLFYNNKLPILASYFDKYLIYLTNKNLNFFTKSVNKHKF